MINRIEIYLIRDNENGFYGTIKLQTPSIQLNLTGFYLPFNETLFNGYEDWRKSHKEFYLPYQSTNYCDSNIPIEVLKNDENHEIERRQNVNFKYSNLKKTINDWLSTRDFSDREKQLRTELGKEDKIMVIISTKDDFAWKFPWHLWNFFDSYRNAWVVLSHSESRNDNSNKNDFLGQKVLAIFDKKDKSEWNDWLETSKINNIDLNPFIGEDIEQDEEVLVKLSEKLKQKHWNIIFFAGHSSSDTNNGEPKFYIKYPKVFLTIKNLENVLSNAINQGLQLAIFNSCDGLGLARELLKLNLPNVIVMREDVPNKVAEAFLKYFLKEFMVNKGIPAFLAVRNAIKSLQQEELKFPSASFLPVMCFNPATEPLVIPPDPELKPKPRQHSLLCLLLKWIFPGLVSDEERY